MCVIYVLIIAVRLKREQTNKLKLNNFMSHYSEYNQSFYVDLSHKDGIYDEQ